MAQMIHRERNFHPDGIAHSGDVRLEHGNPLVSYLHTQQRMWKLIRLPLLQVRRIRDRTGGIRHHLDTQVHLEPWEPAAVRTRTGLALRSHTCDGHGLVEFEGAVHISQRQTAAEIEGDPPAERHLEIRAKPEAEQVRFELSRTRDARATRHHLAWERSGHIAKQSSWMHKVALVWPWVVGKPRDAVAGDGVDRS